MALSRVMLRSSRLPGILLASATLLLLVGSARLVRLNISASVPYGLYALHAVPQTLRRGQLVLVPVPASMMVFHPWWLPLLKPVAGLPGDMLTMQGQHFYINDEDFGPVATESQGHTVPQLASPRVVQAGEVCVATKAWRSLDCRYIGVTPLSQVQAVATPLLTWGGRQ